MDKSIYAFKGEGVAGQVPNRRLGARHTLMIFAQSQSVESAEILAYRIAEDNGWTLVVLQRGGEVNITPDEVHQPYLRSALQGAMQGGSSIVTYEAELPPNT